MPSVRFTTLASGSAGNASLLETGHGSALMDCGLPPRELAARLRQVGSAWDAIQAVIITHTHTDHWNRWTLEHLRRCKIPFLAHPEHQAASGRHAGFSASAGRRVDPQLHVERAI